MRDFISILIISAFVFVNGWYLSKGYYSQQKLEPRPASANWEEVEKDSVWKQSTYVINNPTVRVWDSIGQTSRFYRIKIK